LTNAIPYKLTVKLSQYQSKMKPQAISIVSSMMNDPRRKSTHFHSNKGWTQQIKLTHQISSLKNVVRRKLAMIHSICMIESSSEEDNDNINDSCMYLWDEVDELENAIKQLKIFLRNYE